jgi:hypothetical protein
LKSAFGVEHVSKSSTDTIDDTLTPLLPGSTVRAYDNSRQNKAKAATKNFAWKTAGAGVGLAAGTALAVKTKGKVPFLNKASGRVAAGVKQGYYGSLVGGVGAGTIGGITGNISLHRIKHDPEYKYRER